MFYLNYQKNIKKMWESVSISDKKIKDNEIKPEGIIKKEFKIPLISNSKNVKFKSKTIKFNIYYDKEIKTRPIIYDIHGGGWAYGDKDINDNFCYHLAKEGFNVISLSYTLAFKAKVINQLQEIDYLLNYLYINKDKYYLDFSNLFITGDSAGGQLTYLYAIILSNNEIFKTVFKIENKNNLKINAIAINHGAPFLKMQKSYPFKSVFKAKNDNINRLKMLYGYFYQFKKEYYFTDPNENLTLITSFVPTFILSSKGDTLSIQSEELNELLTKKRLEHEYYFYDDLKVTHVYNCLFPSSKEGKIMNDKIIQYFKKHLTK